MTILSTGGLCERSWIFSSEGNELAEFAARRPDMVGPLVEQLERRLHRMNSPVRVVESGRSDSKVLLIAIWCLILALHVLEVTLLDQLFSQRVGLLTIVLSRSLDASRRMLLAALWLSPILLLGIGGLALGGWVYALIYRRSVSFRERRFSIEVLLAGTAIALPFAFVFKYVFEVLAIFIQLRPFGP